MYQWLIDGNQQQSKVLRVNERKFYKKLPHIAGILSSVIFQEPFVSMSIIQMQQFIW